ncbi:protein FAM217B [Sorex araneus]|uniref:protein FAM217B n=1 Tax=Sorex araneus TaxID=42254 RepID=UPI00243362E1|nr:protein FAM217B [Sorex araneus]XP_054993392.1 protein FAM217B [Sorex araneus]
MFLDFQSMKIIKEDADQDSASDLSDSERVPIAPSPLAPPTLNLRAEEIDPLCFERPLGQAGPEYQYPDFLPSPFRSWDLRDAAMLAGPRPGGALGRFMERLVQLERLQEQTLHWERTKAAKGRAAAGPGTPGVLKSPGRGRLLAAALSRPPQEGPCRPVPLRKKGPPRAEHPGPSPGTLEPCPRTGDMPRSRRALAPKPPSEGSAEEKRRKPSKAARLQRWEPPGGGEGSAGAASRLESNGNLRAPRPPAGPLEPADPKAPRAQAHAGLKKKGSVGPCILAPVSGERRPRASGAKPAASGASRRK